MSGKNPVRVYAKEFVGGGGLTTVQAASVAAAIVAATPPADATGSVYGDVTGALLGPLLAQALHGDEASVALTGDVDDYDLGDGKRDAFYWLIDFAGFDISGFAAPETPGELHCVINTGTVGHILASDAGSAAENWVLSASGNVAMATDAAVLIAYSGTLDRWVAIGGSSSGGGGGGSAIDPADFGALHDANGVNDAAVSGGALSTVTSATAGFTAADTGKRFTLFTTAGVGIRGTLTFVNSTTCTMSTAAGGAMTGARLIWGTDNSAAVIAAWATAQPGDRVELGPGRWFFYGPNLAIPEGVHFGPNGHGPYFPDTSIYANDWGCTLVIDHDASDPFLLLEQGSGVGDFLMFDAGQVPPTASTPVARGAFIQVDVDPLPWSSRETRISGWRIGSPYLCNPYVGLYLRGGGGLVDAPQIGGLYRSVILDHMYDFTSIRRIKADRLAFASESGAPGSSGLAAWYVDNAWAVGVYRADGFKIGELSTYALYGGIFLDDSPDGAQDPGSIQYGYGMVDVLDIDSCVIGIYAKSTNSPGLIVGQAIIGPNIVGYGTPGAYAAWTPSGGVHTPLLIVGSWAVRGSWSVAVAKQDAGTLIVPGTNPGAGSHDSESSIAIRYTFSTTTTDSDPGSGKLRLSNGTQTSATVVRCDLADVAGTDVTTILDTINDQVGTTKGYLRLQVTTDPTRYILFDATNFASPSGYRNVTVSARAGAGGSSPFQEGEELTLTFVPSTVGLTAGAVPSFATPAIVLGTAAAAGAAATVIRSDATIVAFDATVPTTSAEGDAAATGSAAKAARRDHVHGREAFGTTAAAIGTSAGGSATTPSKSDHVHATGAGTPSTQALGDAASTGTGPAAAMTDHKHAMPALSSATPLVEAGSGAVGTAVPSSREDHVHPAAPAAASAVPFTIIGQETRTSDGSTTSWTLDNDFEENTVQAFNLTSGKALVVTETLPNTAVIGAAGTAGDVLSFAYAASAI